MLRVAWCMKLGEGSLFSVNYLLHVACCMDFLKSTLFSVKNLQLIVHIIFKNLCFLPTDMQHATCNMQHATCNMQHATIYSYASTSRTVRRLARQEGHQLDKAARISTSMSHKPAPKVEKV